MQKLFQESISVMAREFFNDKIIIERRKAQQANRTFIPMKDWVEGMGSVLKHQLHGDNQSGEGLVQQGEPTDATIEASQTSFLHRLFDNTQS